MNVQRARIELELELQKFIREMFDATDRRRWERAVDRAWFGLFAVQKFCKITGKTAEELRENVANTGYARSTLLGSLIRLGR